MLLSFASILKEIFLLLLNHSLQMVCASLLKRCSIWLYVLATSTIPKLSTGTLTVDSTVIFVFVFSILSFHNQQREFVFVIFNSSFLFPSILFAEFRKMSVSPSKSLSMIVRYILSATGRNSVNLCAADDHYFICAFAASMILLQNEQQCILLFVIFIVRDYYVCSLRKRLFRWIQRFSCP